MFQEIYFNNLWYYNYDRVYGGESLAWHSLELLRKNNRVHVMVVNENSQRGMYTRFLKEHPDIVEIYRSPLGINKNYGNIPRNFVSIWEFAQPKLVSEVPQPEVKSSEIAAPGVAATSDTPLVPSVATTVETPKEITSSHSLTEESIASLVATMSQPKAIYFNAEYYRIYEEIR